MLRVEKLEDAMNTSNSYCDILGISVPSLEQATKSPDASSYSLLIALLLERGEPVTLEYAAQRFEEAGIAPRDRALASLKKCRPRRAPIYRDGEFYALDPHDDQAELWAFRLGLRPAKVPPCVLSRKSRRHCRLSILLWAWPHSRKLVMALSAGTH